MALAHFRMLINGSLNKDTYIIPEEAHLIIFNSKSAVFMDNNVKDTNHTRHIARKVHFVKNGKKCKFAQD